MGDATCSISGCSKGGRMRRGLCTTHDGRRQRHGDPLWEPASMEARFWAKVDPDGPPPLSAAALGPCWVWKGAKAENGYGRFNTERRLQRPAHRVAYELTVGPVPSGLELDHLCLVKSCVRPAHLEPVTHIENMRRADAAYGIRSARTHCPKGHEYTPENIAPAGLNGLGRGCRECNRIRAREYTRRKRAKS